MEQGSQPRLPAHEPHRITHRDGGPVGVEEAGCRVQVGDEPQPGVQIDLHHRVGALLAFHQIDRPAARHECPRAGWGTDPERPPVGQVVVRQRPVPGGDPLGEHLVVEPVERIRVGGQDGRSLRGHGRDRTQQRWASRHRYGLAGTGQLPRTSRTVFQPLSLPKSR